MGIFANVLMSVSTRDRTDRTVSSWRGVTAWIFERVHRGQLERSRLAVVERVCLAPRQTLSLIDVDGERVLVGTSQDGSPRFYRLNPISRSPSQKCCTEIPVEGKVA